ncbi:MAG: DUF362 domain-containing protein [candidate division WOR-3 bacterium]
MKRDVSRRDFLKLIGIGVVGLAVRPKIVPGLTHDFGSGDLASDVVQCFHEQATSGSTINEPIVQMMMDESVMALAGVRDVGEAWKSFFPGITESSIIGIKVNCINRYLPTHLEVVRCMANGLAQMDFGGTLFPKNNIIVWDRTDSEMTSSGYTIYTGSDPTQVRYVGTNHSGFGYDSSVTFNVNGSSQNPSVILSRMVDYLIDAAVLKTHSQGVVTLCLKNHYGSVHNPGGLQHTGGCSPAIPSLNQQIRDVITPNNIQKLFVIDGLFGLYSGGPGGSPNFNPKVLIMSRDPVACDYQGQNVINIERQARGLSVLNAAQITTAAQPPYSLGTTEVNLIELNNVGMEESGLIDRASRLQISPQPVHGQARVTFALPSADEVSIDVVDAAGRTQAQVYRGHLTRGRHQVNWQTRGQVGAGTYFLRLSSRSGTQTRKVTVLN